MVTYIDVWTVLASRIKGVTQVAQFHVACLQFRSDDPKGRGTYLYKQNLSIFEAIRQYGQTFSNIMPNNAKMMFSSFVDEFNSFFAPRESGSNSRQEQILTGSAVLSAFATEVSFLFSNSQQQICARTELALSHLQRSIVVDAGLRARWRRAFHRGEVACEKIGAIHMLLHSIWAFKIDAAGARTDLIYQKPVNSFTREESFVDGFVLTEWKKASDYAGASKQYTQAHKQLERYAKGALATNELTSYRYAIVVTLKNVDPPADAIIDGITYRNVNIAVDPNPPSSK